MRWNEIALSEKLNLGPNMSHVEDLRDPSYKKDINGRPPAALLVLTKGEGAIIYNWADGNTLDWNDLYPRVEAAMDMSIQSDATQISPHRNGYMIDARLGDGKWSGIRTKHTADIAPILKALKERGLASDSTPIWFGNWASREGESAGSVGKLLALHTKPLTRLTLYHGTSSYRAEEIMKNGLNPVSKDERIWTKVHKDTPGHRAEAIYLTAAMFQANYYANKATMVDKRRKNLDSNGQCVPVILTCTLGTKDMEKLVADDDHMMSNDGATLEDWRDSLGRMGQVAYKGSLPPQRIRVFKRG